MKRFIFGTIPVPANAANFALLALRVFAGLMMAFGHGLGKMPPSQQFIDGVAQLGFPSPVVFAWAAALSELVGGLLLAVGLFTRPAAFFVMCTMATAAFLAHGADPLAKKELALLYLFIALVYMVIGGGRFAIDRFLHGSNGSGGGGGGGRHSRPTVKKPVKR